MAGAWTPQLHVHDTGDGCRLTLVGVTYGNGATLQDAADDLVARLLNLVLGTRASGLRLPAGFGTDPRLLDLLWELGEIAGRGGDIRDRIFGSPEPRDDAA